MLSLEEPSSIAQHISKYKSYAHDITPLTPSIYKMCVKLKKEGL